MKKKIISVIIVLAFVIMISIAYFSHPEPMPPHLDTLTFSNTMKWGTLFLEQASETPHFITSFKNLIVLPPPPKNSSSQVNEEINTLLKYQKNRTTNQIEIITEQELFDGIIIGGNTVSNYMNPKLYPKTAPLLNQAVKDLDIVIFYEKSFFDRVRPSALDSRIMPAIEVPAHPSYPSGHSTQAHFVALFLGEMLPQEKDSLWAEADAIAKNREIAGLHYPSDSQAGIELAKQVFALMMQNQEFKKRFDQARVEWK